MYHQLNNDVSVYPYFIDFYKFKNYVLRYIDHSDKSEKEVQLKAMNYHEHVMQIMGTIFPFSINYSLAVVNDGKTALLRISSFSGPGDTALINFVRTSFDKINRQGITSLIIDLRGNGGGRTRKLQ